MNSEPIDIHTGHLLGNRGSFQNTVNGAVEQRRP